MAEEITATLVVKFGEVSEALSANASLVIQVDDRPDGLNNGNTTFIAGQPVGFLVYTSDNVGNLRVESSVGGIGSVGGGGNVITQVVTFANSDTAQLSFPAVSGLATVWLGNSGGVVTLENQRTLKLDAKTTAVLEVTYSASFAAYLLSGLPSEINGTGNYLAVVAAIGTVES